MKKLSYLLFNPFAGNSLNIPLSFFNGNVYTIQIITFFITNNIPVFQSHIRDTVDCTSLELEILISIITLDNGITRF